MLSRSNKPYDICIMFIRMFSDVLFFVNPSGPNQWAHQNRFLASVCFMAENVFPFGFHPLFRCYAVTFREGEHIYIYIICFSKFIYICTYLCIFVGFDEPLFFNFRLQVHKNLYIIERLRLSKCFKHKIH